jgi:hypothetical protein
MTRLERRETSLLRLRVRARLNARLNGQLKPTPDFQGHARKLKLKKAKVAAAPSVSFAESEALPYTTPEQHHHISQSRNFSLHLSTWLGEHSDDPATKVRIVYLLHATRAQG